MDLFTWIGSILLAWILVAAVARLFARPGDTNFEFRQEQDATRLIVIVPGLTGRSAIQPSIELAAEALAPADLLVADYDTRVLSNADIYGITNELEAQVHKRFDPDRHKSIVLVGHSMGAMILRKALLWANGLEEDRVAPKDVRPWSGHIERLVSLAGINRGWSIDPKPMNMDWGQYFAIWFGERFGMLTGTGKLLFSVRRGAPFVADARVQWVRLARPQSSDDAARPLPQVIHLLGDRDDIVSREDVQDLGVAKDTVFVTLHNTDHGNIAEALQGQDGGAAERRREAIHHALRGEIDALDQDAEQKLDEDPGISRIVYIMHGIRDYGRWTDRLRTAIEEHLADRSDQLVVVNKKYGYFPMGPFLLYWDRQRNVRRFMDEYTENIARYPNAKRFDFVGHSNGTYILASALQRYDSLNVDRVFFAGSVVPKHYPWRDLMDRGRVEKVVNVVASGDWVVAIFPKIFEQVADWLSVKPTVGILDIGSAGFRGFQDADDPESRVRNMQFAEGQHGTGVDTTNERKLKAIVAYAVDGDEEPLVAFENSKEQWGWLDVLSNISWSAWLILLTVLGSLCYLAFSSNLFVGIAFVVILLALLTSI